MIKKIILLLLGFGTWSLFMPGGSAPRPKNYI